MRLEGQRVVLTGAAGGIGTLLAQRLRAQGAILIGVDRVPCPACDETLIADLSSEHSLGNLSDQLASRRVDILCNMAGLQYFGPFEWQDPANIRLLYLVNLIAPARLIRTVLPQMKARESGQIVNIGSVLGAVNYPHFAAYSSAKAGLRSLSECIRRELGKSSIVVTHVAPRAVRTAFNDEIVNRFLDLAKMRADEPAKIAERIAQAIVERRKDVTIGAAERVYSRLNALFPRLVDVGLLGTTAKARALFKN
jgi:short-subunit dehydrogenase